MVKRRSQKKSSRRVLKNKSKRRRSLKKKSKSKRRRSFKNKRRSRRRSRKRVLKGGSSSARMASMKYLQAEPITKTKPAMKEEEKKKIRDRRMAFMTVLTNTNK